MLAGRTVWLLACMQVCVDMGEPILDGPTVPTTLAPTREGGMVVAAPIDLGGQRMAVTAVSMGNPHAVVFVEVRGVAEGSAADDY